MTFTVTLTLKVTLIFKVSVTLRHPQGYYQINCLQSRSKLCFSTIHFLNITVTWVISMVTYIIIFIKPFLSSTTKLNVVVPLQKVSDIDHINVQAKPQFSCCWRFLKVTVTLTLTLELCNWLYFPKIVSLSYILNLEWFFILRLSFIISKKVIFCHFLALFQDNCDLGSRSRS